MSIALEYCADLYVSTLRYCVEAMGRTSEISARFRVEKRTVPLAPPLRERRQQYVAERLAAGPGYADGGYVVADPLGNPYAPSALSDAFRKIAKRAGVKKRLHDARHTFATLLIGSGIDVRTTADLLGHSTPTVTLSIYSHQILGRKEDAVAKVGERLQTAIAGHKKA
jgi:integrase